MAETQLLLFVICSDTRFVRLRMFVAEAVRRLSRLRQNRRRAFDQAAGLFGH
jgi:hypothetical protein